MKIVAGDIGGTKTLLRCVEAGPDEPKVVAERRFVSEEWATFDDLLRTFVGEVSGEIDSACFAVAGPVVDAQAHLTNLHWVLSREKLQTDFRIRRVRLVNDFYAVAAGIPHVKEFDLVNINHGKRDRSCPIAILGAGTGLGEAFVIPDGDHWRVLPSEGGHADFAPVTEEHEALLTFLRKKYGRVSYERVLSGAGLVNIFTFLASLTGVSHPILAQTPEQQPGSVAEAAMAGDATAVHAMEIFAEIYGAESGNLALKSIARGGVYIAGGIAGKNLKWFQDGRFLEFYGAKGRFSDLVKSIPVDIIADANVGLLGAVALAKDRSSVSSSLLRESSDPGG